MSNIQQERKMAALASQIERFIQSLLYDEHLDLKFSGPEKEVLDLLIAAQSKALDLANSFQSAAEENT